MQNNRMMGKFYDKSTSVKTQRTLNIKEKRKQRGKRWLVHVAQPTWLIVVAACL